MASCLVALFIFSLFYFGYLHPERDQTGYTKPFFIAMILFLLPGIFGIKRSRRLTFVPFQSDMAAKEILLAALSQKKRYAVYVVNPGYCNGSMKWGWFARLDVTILYDFDGFYINVLDNRALNGQFYFLLPMTNRLVSDLEELIRSKSNQEVISTS